MPVYSQTLYKTPFSAAYWRQAAEDFRRPRNLAFAALMIAVCVALSHVPAIRLDFTDLYTAKVTWGFLARSVCSMVCGPVMGILSTLFFSIVPALAPCGYFLQSLLRTC